LEGFVANLVPVTLGNVIGGAVMVGVVYWFVTFAPVHRAPDHRPRRDHWPAAMGRPALISFCAYVDSRLMDEITVLQAEVLKTLASPRRLEILHVVARGPIEVGRLAAVIGASQPNVSQHLAVLRSAGIVEAEREGREVRYRVTDPDVMVACNVMRSVLERRLARLGAMASNAVGLSTSTRPASR
jgi:DNA-binding transcriptional ArsR family regulator